MKANGDLLELLRALEATVRLHSFGRAAEHLGCSYGTVRRRVERLEAYIGGGALVREGSAHWEATSLGSDVLAAADGSLKLEQRLALVKGRGRVIVFPHHLHAFPRLSAAAAQQSVDLLIRDEWRSSTDHISWQVNEMARGARAHDVTIAPLIGEYRESSRRTVEVLYETEHWVLRPRGTGSADGVTLEGLHREGVRLMVPGPQSVTQELLRRWHHEDELADPDPMLEASSAMTLIDALTTRVGANAAVVLPSDMAVHFARNGLYGGSLGETHEWLPLLPGHPGTPRLSAVAAYMAAPTSRTTKVLGLLQADLVERRAEEHGERVYGVPAAAEK